MKATIAAIAYHLPENSLTNEQLAREFPEWDVQKIEEKTGIAERWIAGEDECSSDLGVAAAQKLFSSRVCTPDQIDYLIVCTQSPDYFLPTTACLLQQRLGVPCTAGALDINLGCSGYVYGLGLAKGLIETGQAKNVLFITAETYSKFLHPRDKNVRTLFGDAATATLLRAVDDPGELIGPFVYGTDGSGAANLIVSCGGLRQPWTSDPIHMAESEVNVDSPVRLFMNGPEIFSFTLRVVPQAVADLLERSGKSLDDIDLFVFHQANQYMLDHLRRKLGIPAEKFFVGMRHCGNTVSSTIPIALCQAVEQGRLNSGQLALLVGFGVGYSWGATLVWWA